MFKLSNNRYFKKLQYLIIGLRVSNLLTIRIQTTSAGGLPQITFNSNRLNANSVWMQLMQID